MEYTCTVASSDFAVALDCPAINLSRCICKVLWLPRVQLPDPAKLRHWSHTISLSSFLTFCLGCSDIITNQLHRHGSATPPLRNVPRDCFFCKRPHRQPHCTHQWHDATPPWKQNIHNGLATSTKKGPRFSSPPLGLVRRTRLSRARGLYCGHDCGVCRGAKGHRGWR